MRQLRLVTPTIVGTAVDAGRQSPTPSVTCLTPAETGSAPALLPMKPSTSAPLQPHQTADVVRLELPTVQTPPPIAVAFGIGDAGTSPMAKGATTNGPSVDRADIRLPLLPLRVVQEATRSDPLRQSIRNTEVVGRRPQPAPTKASAGQLGLTRSQRPIRQRLRLSVQPEVGSRQ